MSSAQAGNLTFLSDTPITELTKDELKSFKQFVRKNMSTLEDRQTAVWKSSTRKRKALSSQN